MGSGGFLWSYAFKDLGRNRTRTLLGIFGVATSIFLLTTVSFITDSISNSFVDYLTTDSGGQDMVLSTQHYYDEPENWSTYFAYEPISQQIQNNVTGLENFLPRSFFWGKTNGSAINEINFTFYFSLCAMDIKLEEQVDFGQWHNLDPNLEISNGLPINSCMISPELAQIFNLTTGDEIKIYVNYLRAWVNLTVASTYEQTLKFPINYERDIIVDIEWWGDLANQIDNRDDEIEDWRGMTNNLIILLADSELVYDVRDISGTENYISQIGANILLTIGIDQWNLDYPKLDNLYVSEYLTMSLQVIFIMISFIAMLISGILINGILSTSVEEKIREYGINRVLGARKTYSLKLILIQATIITLLGVSLGIIGAAILVKYIAIPIVETLVPPGYLSEGITFVAQPTSILTSYIIGVTVSMLVSISPAIKVMKMKIVESINPYRHSDEVYELKRDQTVNYKLIIFGTILAVNGLFVYFLIPRIFLTLNIALIAGTLIGTLLIFLIGVSLLAIGLIPILIKFLCFVFQPFARKIMNIVKITVFRHQRRNISTIVMFVLSFSFILFTTSMVQIQVEQIGAMIQYNRGSDLQLVPTSYDIEAPTVSLQKDIMQIEGIERTSSILAGTNDLENIYSEENKDFSVTLGDYINFQSTSIHLYGIDRNYKDTVFATEYIKFTEGNSVDAFDAVFENTTEINIIISTAIANGLDLHLNDNARLTFTRGTEEEPVIATIVGVASNMPGLGRFKEGQYQVSNGGVIISDSNYINYFNIPGGDNAFIDRIFIKIQEGYDHKEIRDQMYDLVGSDYDVYIRVTSQEMEEADSTFVVIKYLFFLILLGTVLIGLFGLITSAYSSILERKREIAIIRTLGLHGSEVNKMFLIENLILLISSGTSGGIIGYFMAALLTENLTLFTESPRILAIPWDIIGLIYIISIFVLIIGMRFLLRRLKKQNLIEIYRETL